jgi:GxxExxY protein
MKSRDELEGVAAAIVDACIAVHRALGPGLLESSYQACLAHELRKRGYAVRCSVELPVEYDGIRIELGYRIDMLIEESVIVENKSVKALAQVHEAQLLAYMKHSGVRLGFLINWNVPLVKDGIKRMVNKL